MALQKTFLIHSHIRDIAKALKEVSFKSINRTAVPKPHIEFVREVMKSVKPSAINMYYIILKSEKNEQLKSNLDPIKAEENNDNT